MKNHENINPKLPKTHVEWSQHYIFLKKNGFNLAPDDPEEIFRFPMAVVKGELSIEQMQKWFKKNCKIL